MPATYWIARDANTVLLILRGEVDLRERMSLIRAIIMDEAFVPGMAVLEDRRELQTIDDSNTIQCFLSVVKHAGEAFRGTRWAAVTPDSVGYGMMNVMAVWAEDLGILLRPFRSMGDACSWLRQSEEANGARPSL